MRQMDEPFRFGEKIFRNGDVVDISHPRYKSRVRGWVAGVVPAGRHVNDVIDEWNDADGERWRHPPGQYLTRSHDSLVIEVETPTVTGGGRGTRWPMLSYLTPIREESPS